MMSLAGRWYDYTYTWIIHSEYLGTLYTHFAYVIYKVNLSYAACPRSVSEVGSMGLEKKIGYFLYNISMRIA